MLLLKITHPRVPEHGAISPHIEYIFRPPPNWAEVLRKQLGVDLMILEQGDVSSSEILETDLPQMEQYGIEAYVKAYLETYLS